jgi:cell pole-organizing protein PopZ
MAGRAGGIEMQNALKTLWTDELSDQLRQLSAPQGRRPAPAQVAENVVRAPFPQRGFPGVAPQQKPELSAALNAVTERAAEKLADADAQIRAARDEAKRYEIRAAEAEQRVQEEAAHAQELLKEADERIFAAETRAMESKEDLAYLENYIRERFAI